MTSYEMRISVWSSDGCSSVLPVDHEPAGDPRIGGQGARSARRRGARSCRARRHGLVHHALRLGLPHRAADAGVPAARPQGRGGRLMFVDSHCHLNYKALVEEQQALLERARARGVERMLNLPTRESAWDDVLATAAREPAVWA